MKLSQELGNSQRSLLIIAAILAFTAVGMGSFGSHYFKGRLSEYSLSIYEIGNRYHFYHSLALLFMALSAILLPSPLFMIAYWAMLLGVLLFSGSLYVLAISGATFWGAVTPVGGLLFLISWLIYIFALLWS